jgi:hypothetical protein
MKIKGLKFRRYAGEKKITWGLGIMCGATGSAASGIAWYMSLGVIGKVGLALGVVSPPIAVISAVGTGTAVIGANFARTQLLKKEKDEAKAFFDT